LTTGKLLHFSDELAEVAPAQRFGGAIDLLRCPPDVLTGLRNLVVKLGGCSPYRSSQAAHEVRPGVFLIFHRGPHLPGRVGREALRTFG
jgi:hypothetical protein